MRFLFGLVFICLLSSAALADTIRETVRANRATPVGSHAVYGPQCGSGTIPKMKITQQPKHGTVTFKQFSGKLGEKAGRCAGKTVKGTAVIYRPDKGFRGEDVFRVRFVMDMYTYGSTKIRNVSNKYVIQVK